ncbi:DUF58 domain-containing protein [Candidatus Colwellia aromaticivorans]|uniref:DUF58 domain-containing protein n=1 Tax=Candidatus Colwellia aromaticivorans TaxID=2267621 RepID=UPI000DF274A0|nr:DUF58 domain-containing protein [Candidatus Colwellia aromaticivorans]
MNIFRTIKQASQKVINKRFDHWLSRRMPSRFQQKLSNRNIFILPTRFGFTYLFFDILLFLLGTNYQNNIILLLSYLLASLFITVMMHSFYNFSQLTFSSKAKQTGFAKQVLNYPITITGHKIHFDINFIFSESQHFLKVVKLAQCDTDTIEILLPWYAKQRGVYSLGRVKVFSEYSLGLFITWSLLDFSHQAIVFPQPKRLTDNQQFLTGLDESNGASMQATVGGEDYSELKNYVLGESQARIAWKQLARGQGKLSKNYQAQQGSLLWLKFSNMPSSDIETKLQFLCFLILEYSHNKQCFGLVLDLPPSITNSTKNSTLIKIEPNSGYQHQQSCLIALAKVTD